MFKGYRILDLFFCVTTDKLLVLLEEVTPKGDEVQGEDGKSPDSDIVILRNPSDIKSDPNLFTVIVVKHGPSYVVDSARLGVDGKYLLVRRPPQVSVDGSELVEPGTTDVFSYKG